MTETDGSRFRLEFGPEQMMKACLAALPAALAGHRNGDRP